MNDDDRYQLGMQHRRAVLGAEWVDRALSQRTDCRDRLLMKGERR